MHYTIPPYDLLCQDSKSVAYSMPGSQGEMQHTQKMYTQSVFMCVNPS